MSNEEPTAEAHYYPDVDVVFLCDVELHSDNQGLELWESGPYVFQYEDYTNRTVRTDAPTRSTNFPNTLNAYVFGKNADRGERLAAETRFHVDLASEAFFQEDSFDKLGTSGAAPSSVESRTELSEEVEAHSRFRLNYLELLMEDASAGNAASPGDKNVAVLAVHCSFLNSSLGLVTQLAHDLAQKRGNQAQGQVRGQLLYERLMDVPAVQQLGDIFPSSHGSDVEGGVFTLVFSGHAPFPAGTAAGEDFVSSEQLKALYCAATLQPVEKAHVDITKLRDAANEVRWLSKDWSMLVRRHGAAFQLYASTASEFSRFAPIYFRTLYADAFMLVRLQDRMVRRWESESISLIGRATSRESLSAAQSEIASLSRRVAVDSVRYWIMPSAASTGRVMEILAEAQMVSMVPKRFSVVERNIQTLDELARRDVQERQAVAAEAQARAQDRLARIVLIVSATVFPLTLAGDFFNLFSIAPSVLSVSITLAVCTTIALATFFFSRAAYRSTKRT